jgi:hypothetical protein
MPIPYVLPFILGQKAATLTDDFTTKDTAKWSWSGTATVSSGRVNLPVQTSDSILANAQYDLSESSISARLVQTPTVETGGAGGTFATLAFWESGQNRGLMMMWSSGSGTSSLIFREKTAPGTFDDTSIAYNAAQHKYFRIRESGGTVFWDTSADGATWTNRRSKTVAMDIHSGYPYLDGNWFGTISGTYGTSIWDDFNCNPLPSSLTETFATIDTTTKWSSFSGTAKSVSGRLNLTCASPYSTLRSQSNFDLTGSAISVALLQIPRQGPAEQNETLMMFQAPLGSLDSYVFNNLLYFREFVGSASETNITYDPVAHKFLRIREASGTIFWDTSPDGVTWTNRRSKTAAIDYTEGYVTFKSGLWGTGTSGDIAIFDNFNTLPPTSELIDTFTTQDTAKWTWTGTSSVSSGQANLPVTSVSFATTPVAYNLIGSSVSVCAVSMPDIETGGAGGTIAGLIVRNIVDTTDYLEILCYGSSGTRTIYFREAIDGATNDTTLTYDPVAHRYWRIRESGGTVFWDTSADGATWTNQRNKTPGAIDLTAVQLQLAGQTFGTLTAGGTAVFDNVNNTLPKVETLIDTFATKDTTKWGWGGTAAVTSGQVVLTPTLGWTDYIFTNQFFSLLGSGVIAKLTPPNVGNGGTATDFSVSTSIANTWVGFSWYSNILAFAYKDNNVSDNTTATYDSTNHKWLRIREYNGTIYWDTSADGSWWTNRRTRVAGFPLNNVYVAFLTGYSGTEPSPGTAIWDTVNAKTEYLTDRFDTKDTVEWNYTGNAAVSGGRLQITPTSGYDVNRIITQNLYDLTGSSIVTELAQTPNLGNGTTQAYVIARINGTNYEAIGYSGGKLYMDESVAGIPSTDIATTYDPVAHRWLRMREASGTIYWDTSPDGVTWTNRRNKAAGISLTALYIQVESAYFGTEPSPGVAVYDNVNLVPIGNFTDTFATQDTAKWIFGAATSVSGGQLLMPANASATGSVSGLGPYFDLTASSATAQIIQYPTAASGNSMNFGVNAGLGSTYFIMQWWGADQKVYCGEIVSAVSDWDGGVSTTDKWWRIRESNGIVYWDTSANGLSWTNRRSKVPQIQTIGKTWIDIWTEGSGGGTGIVESVNVAAVQANTQGLLRMF